jgi:hypothetical protein
MTDSTVSAFNRVNEVAPRCGSIRTSPFHRGDSDQAVNTVLADFDFVASDDVLCVENGRAFDDFKDILGNDCHGHGSSFCDAPRYATEHDLLDTGSTTATHYDVV